MREITPRSLIPILLLAAVLLYAALLIGAPLVAIVEGAFSKGIPALVKAITAEDAIYSFRLTFLLAVSAAAINTVAGVALAWVLVRHRFPGRQLVDALVSAPF